MSLLGRCLPDDGLIVTMPTCSGAWFSLDRIGEDSRPNLVLFRTEIRASAVNGKKWLNLKAGQPLTCGNNFASVRYARPALFTYTPAKRREVMKRIIAGLLIAVTLSGCFPIFVPVGPGYHRGHHHGHHHGHYR